MTYFPPFHLFCSIFWGAMLNKPHNWMLFVDPDIFFFLLRILAQGFFVQKGDLTVQWHNPRDT